MLQDFIRRIENGLRPSLAMMEKDWDKNV